MWSLNDYPPSYSSVCSWGVPYRSLLTLLQAHHWVGNMMNPGFPYFSEGDVNAFSSFLSEEVSRERLRPSEYCECLASQGHSNIVFGNSMVSTVVLPCLLAVAGKSRISSSFLLEYCTPSNQLTLGRSPVFSSFEHS